ncbi:hypothetical protein F441_06770 [Phytophthora nicotianae CJ01A1]|uniref:Uncharacterized protein n=2 Tax=Phytophthora nicotianae TaxID=4792 RepID=W2X955_PHYNI|nr:hypothetical protein F444_06834 [Phytophthora nicotianae P1976]ETP19241.1 hypothetical protein F441_06770 [Phytophthora nicotianae CJ01A1]
MQTNPKNHRVRDLIWAETVNNAHVPAATHYGEEGGGEDRKRAVSSRGMVRASGDERQKLSG